MSAEEKRQMINLNHGSLSVRAQCQLLDLNRSSLYYDSLGENSYNLHLMRLIDEEYTRYPFKGVLRMVEFLKSLGHHVNPKRARRLLRLMGLEAVYPKKNLSKPNLTHKKYPYLLKGLEIVRPNQVWCTDITYIRLAQGFVYLVAIMDWFSRYVLSWQLSNSLDASFCVDTLQDALMIYGFPKIHNSDQGSQYTSDDYTGILLANNIQISMDGKGRAFDNIFIERLWRSVKYEEVYLRDYASAVEAKKYLESYFKFYNFGRHHQSLNYKKPAEIYFGKEFPVDYLNVDNDLLVPRKVNHLIKVGPQVQIQ